MIDDNINDINQISDIISLYIKAHQVQDSQIMKLAFSPNAIIYGINCKSMVPSSLGEMFTYVNKSDEAPEKSAKITDFSISDNIANVRMETEKVSGEKYTDLFILSKNENQWKIVSKTYIRTNRKIPCA